MTKSSLNPLLAGVAAVAIIAAGYFFMSNQYMAAELQSLKETSEGLKKDAQKATERANVAERSLEETKEDMAKVQASNDSVKHSVTQLRNQLEQVQIQANTAREDFEKKLKAQTDELSKAQAQVTELEKKASDLTADLANERKAKEAAEAEAKKEREARQAAAPAAP